LVRVSISSIAATSLLVLASLFSAWAMGEFVASWRPSFAGYIVLNATVVVGGGSGGLLGNFSLPTAAVVILTVEVVSGSGGLAADIYLVGGDRAYTVPVSCPPTGGGCTVLEGRLTLPPGEYTVGLASRGPAGPATLSIVVKAWPAQVATSRA